MERRRWSWMLGGLAALLLVAAWTAGAREFTDVPDPDAAVGAVTPTGEPAAETPPAAPPAVTAGGEGDGDFAEPVEGTVEVNPSLRVRAGVWGKVIGGLRDGAKITVVGQEGEFYKIAWEGGIAYVHRNYVSVPGRKATQEPVTPPPPGSTATPPSGGQEPPAATPPASNEPVPPGPKPTGDTVGAAMGDGTAAGAVNWALDQLPGGTQKGYNRNVGKTTRDSGATWNNWCLAFVSTAWGRKVPELQAYSAILAYRNCQAAGKIVNDRDPPAGAPLFQDTTSSNEWGHIFIATGRKTPSGDPIIITTGWTHYDGIHEITLSQMEAKYPGKYLGWARVP